MERQMGMFVWGGGGEMMDWGLWLQARGLPSRGGRRHIGFFIIVYSSTTFIFYFHLKEVR